MDKLSPIAPLSAAFALASIPAVCNAGTSFGIYDARTMAMGGTSVASANNDNAQFYNAALLAFNEEIEERTQDARFLFPILITQVAESIVDVDQIAQDNLFSQIDVAVDNFNAMPDAMTAQSVVDATAGLDSALGQISDNDIFGDLYVGLAISEPGKFQGAGFFLGVRGIGGGQTEVTDTDRALLAAYREGLTFVASGGAQGAPHPELFDANGALIDPSADFDSSVNAAGVAIAEIGVAISTQIQLFGSPFAAGMSIKIMEIETFDDVETLSDSSLDADRNRDFNVTPNFDVGLVKQLGENWRLGFAVKDIIPDNYETNLGATVRLRPRPRIGAAYQTDRWQIALDADVIQNEPLGSERATQETAIGAEWAVIPSLKLRAGYRADILGNRDGIASVGLGTVWKRLAVDFAYAQGGDARSGALQFGVVF